ncbi:MAG: 30S ribosomal protein THX [Pyrinomonadaceae bacterium]|nr:30S ribosomal protein THX [Pyrinomonadaceae bacterium]
MGRGDKRTRRGKIAAGSFGKSRPKNENRKKVSTEKAVVEIQPEPTENA